MATLLSHMPQAIPMSHSIETLFSTVADLPKRQMTHGLSGLARSSRCHSQIGVNLNAWQLICSIGGMTLLFGDEAYRSVGQTKPVSSAFFSLLVHGAVIMALLVASLVPMAMKIPDRLRPTMLAIPPPMPPPPPPAGVHVARTVRSAPSKFIFPTARPLPSLPSPREVVIAEAPPVLEAGEQLGGVPGGIPGGITGGTVGGIPGGFLPPAPPPAPVPPASVAAPKVPAAPTVAQERIQVDSEVQESKLVVMIKPQYPMLAMQARIQGKVRLAAIIDKDGKITELKVVSGHALLVDSALAAIKQWRYRPTFLHGEPVEVATQIIVDFHLNL
jgi:protein TonB